MVRERKRDAHVTMTTQHICLRLYLTCLHVSVSTQNRRVVVKLLRSACLGDSGVGNQWLYQSLLNVSFPISVFIEVTGSDSDSDDGLFDRLDLAPVRKKMVLDHENGQ